MTDRRALALSLIVPAICWFACWPFVDMGVNDDFGYAFVVRRLLETGSLHYNGWCSPILGVQALWGAGFSLVFGFSHDTLRLSTLPIAMLCGGLTYTLHRRLEIPVRWATFATLLLVASPLFTPWSASFMTDVPALAFTLGLFHAALSLAKANDSRRTLRLALLLAAIGVLGGTIRQTNFVFAGVLLVSEAFRRRRTNFADIVPAILLLAICTASLLRWYAVQPYATVDPLPPPATWPRASISLAGLGLTLVFILCPLAVALRRFAGVGIAPTIATIAACGLICGLLVTILPQSSVAHFALGLWSANTLTPTGMLADGQDAPGERPVTFDLPIRVAIAACVYATLAILALAAFRERRAIYSWILGTNSRTAVRPEAFIVHLGIVSAVYVALLVPRAAERLVFDRYLLPLMPIVTLSALFLQRRRLEATRVGRAAWLLLLVYAGLGVAITSDHFAELRARSRIAAHFLEAGEHRTAIANGISYDGWTQLEAAGYINDSRVRLPANAYRPSADDERRARYFWFLPFTPAIEPKWIIANVVTPPKRTAGVELFEYRTMLPPTRRWLAAYPVRELSGAREIPANSTQHSERR